MCGRLRRVLLPWLLAFVLATSAAFPDEPPLSLIETNGEPPQSAQMPTWNSFTDLVTMIEQESNSFQLELKELLNGLHESQTEVNALRISLERSEQSLADYERSMKAERKAAMEALDRAIEIGAKAERSRDRWKLAGLIGIGTAVLEAVVIGLIVALK